MEIIGDKGSFHFLIGDEGGGCLREVDIYYQNISLTPIDKMAYVPQFCHSMRKELQELKLHKMNPDGCFLSLGPTTDDCSCRITLSGEEARLLFDVGDEAVHTALLPISYLVNIYERVIGKLDAHRA